MNIEELRNALKQIMPDLAREADYLTDQEVIMYSTLTGFFISVGK